MAEVICCVQPKAKNVRLRILLIGEIFRSLSLHLSSTDSLNFLSCHFYAYNLKSPWITMYTNLQLSSVFNGANLSVGVLCKVPRSIVLYCFYHLGYNCVRCYTPLTGPQGFFACTNLCNSCTLRTFKDAGSRIYVSGSVSQLPLCLSAGGLSVPEYSRFSY
jgi:hypothetical protein